MRKINEMKIYYHTEDDVIRNLKDAGCDDCMINHVMIDLNTGKLSESICILNQHRCNLLDSLHHTQKRIDCLDYLVYILQKLLAEGKGRLND